MPKSNQKNERKFDHLFNLVIIMFIILFNRANIVYGANINLVEVSKIPEGIQYIERKSLDTKGIGIIEVTTKYLKIDTNDSKKLRRIFI